MIHRLVVENGNAEFTFCMCKRLCNSKLISAKNCVELLYEWKPKGATKQNKIVNEWAIKDKEGLLRKAPRSNCWDTNCIHTQASKPSVVCIHSGRGREEKFIHENKKK